MSAEPSCHAEPPRARPPHEVAGTLTIALVGRPNSGKSSLYNVLTGGDAHVGNYPGITVDILEGDVTLPSGASAVVADLPGLYSVEATVDAAHGRGRRTRVPRRACETERRARSSSCRSLDPTRLALGLRLTRELASREASARRRRSRTRTCSRAEGRTVDVARALRRASERPSCSSSARDRATKAVVLAAIDDRLPRGQRRAGLRRASIPSRVAEAVVKDVRQRARSCDVGA